MSIPNLKKFQPYAYFLCHMHFAQKICIWLIIKDMKFIYLLPLPELL